MGLQSITEQFRSNREIEIEPEKLSSTQSIVSIELYVLFKSFKLEEDFW